MQVHNLALSKQTVQVHNLPLVIHNISAFSHRGNLFPIRHALWWDPQSWNHSMSKGRKLCRDGFRSSVTLKLQGFSTRWSLPLLFSCRGFKPDSHPLRALNPYSRARHTLIHRNHHVVPRGCYTGTGRGGNGDLVHARLRHLHNPADIQAHKALPLRVGMCVVGRADEINWHPCHGQRCAHRHSEWSTVGDHKGVDTDRRFVAGLWRSKVRRGKSVNS